MHHWELVIEGDQDMQRHQRLVIAVDQDLQQHQVMPANVGLRTGAGSAPDLAEERVAEGTGPYLVLVWSLE